MVICVLTAFFIHTAVHIQLSNRHNCFVYILIKNNYTFFHMSYSILLNFSFPVSRYLSSVHFC